MDAVLADYSTAPIAEPEKALLAFVEKVNRNSSSISEADFEPLRRAGWSDEAIHDAIAVCALFNFYNRWVDATGVHELSPEESRLSGQRLARRGYLLTTRPAVEAVERYLRCLKERNLDKAPLAPDVTFEGPLTSRLTGATAVVQFLSGVAEQIRDIRVQQHIADGEYVASRLDIETPATVIPVFDCFRVSDGLIREIRAFFDPRPLAR